MDAVTTPEFEQTLGGWIDEGEIRFIVDFTGLDYISSAGLRGILTSVKRLKAEGGELFLLPCTVQSKRYLKFPDSAPLSRSMNQ